jgi:hypothetical protein
VRVTDETPKPDRTNRLLELAAYDRPWVGRLGLALVLFLWLLVSVVGFAAAVWVGLAVAGVGGTLILVEVWLERSGDRHATFAVAWHLSGKVAAGIALIVMAVVNADGWRTVLLAGFGLLTLLPVLLLATLWWRNSR